MAVERKFIEEGARKARVEKYLTKELKRAGYGGMDIARTPLGTQVTIYAEKPGIVIGKGGKLVHQLTQDLAQNFGVESPQIEVQQVNNPSFNAQIMAERLANALERGWYFRKAGQSMMRRVMDAGALGCEIVISGKLTGPRSRTEKFISGYIKHSGKPAIDLVDRGYSVAVKKLGVIGCQVRIIPPDVRLPDDFRIEKPPVAEPAVETKPAKGPVAPMPVATPAPEKKSDLDQLLESEPMAAPSPLDESSVKVDEDEGVTEDAILPEENADSAPCAKEE